ncbi:MAG: RsmE family RNA methyltransferase [Armatimonadota bacterium]
MAHRFYLPPNQIIDGITHFSDDQRKQIRNVLRLHAGDTVAVFDGSSLEYDVELRSDETGRITNTRELHTEPGVRITLVQSLPKGEKLEFILQKGTEIGISSFLIITTRRSVPTISADKLPKRLDRWRSIVKEAAEQSGRARVPDVDGIFKLKDALAHVKGEAKGLIAWEEEKEISLPSLMSDLSGSKEIFLFIGPEGGFDPEEVSLASNSGAAPVSLGPRILRTETAAIVGSALLIYGIDGFCR